MLQKSFIYVYDRYNCQLNFKKCHIDISLNEVEMELILRVEMFHHQQEPEHVYVTSYFEDKGKCPAGQA